jgi:hypothetical protein
MAVTTLWPKCSQKDYVKEKFQNTIGKGTHHLLPCSAVPQPPVPPSDPEYFGWYDVKMLLAYKKGM